MARKWSAIVHSGAGNIAKGLESAHRAGCLRALELAVEILNSGGSAMEAVLAAVHDLEDNPLFNAGVGAVLDARGVVTHDACICRASDLGYGAAAAFCGVRHPIDLARAVLEDRRHCLIVGPSALAFAREQGLSLVDPEFFVTSEARTIFEARRMREAEEGSVDPREDWAPSFDRGNTVGAVVRDDEGEICAATSTGGLLMKIPGRVGDSPIAGHGTYAHAGLGGLSATGHGETLMRTVFALSGLQAMRGAIDPARALREALDDATARVGGKVGAIGILPNGIPVHARNTRGMGVAFQVAGGAPQSAFDGP